VIAGWVIVFFARALAAQTPSPALVVLEKRDRALVIVDPATLKIAGRVPAGPDPHEVECSPDGRRAYISNYGGDGSLHTISVVDLDAQKALPAIDLGALRSPHGLAFVGGKLYFTVESNKVVGRVDPATQAVDWLMGTGQDGTHMVVVSPALDRVFTSNVSSGTISIFEQVERTARNFGTTWRLTNVAAGRGAEGFDLAPDGKTIWTANAQDGTVTVIDVAAKKATETFAIPVRGNRLKFTRDGGRVLVSGSPSGSTRANLVILDVASHQVVKSFDFGGASAGILVLPDGSRAFIAVSEGDKVVGVDLQKLQIVGEIATGHEPDGLAWAQRK